MEPEDPFYTDLIIDNSRALVPVFTTKTKESFIDFSSISHSNRLNWVTRVFFGTFQLLFSFLNYRSRSFIRHD